MRGKKILECKIFGRISSWGNPPHEEIWKSNLEEQLSRMKPQEPAHVQKFSVSSLMHFIFKVVIICY